MTCQQKTYLSTSSHLTKLGWPGTPRALGRGLSLPVTCFACPVLVSGFHLTPPPLPHRLPVSCALPLTLCGEADLHPPPWPISPTMFHAAFDRKKVHLFDIAFPAVGYALEMTQVLLEAKSPHSSWADDAILYAEHAVHSNEGLQWQYQKVFQMKVKG